MMANPAGLLWDINVFSLLRCNILCRRDSVFELWYSVMGAALTLLPVLLAIKFLLIGSAIASPGHNPCLYTVLLFNQLALLSFERVKLTAGKRFICNRSWCNFSDDAYSER